MIGAKRVDRDEDNVGPWIGTTSTPGQHGQADDEQRDSGATSDPEYAGPHTGRIRRVQRPSQAHLGSRPARSPWPNAKMAAILVYAIFQQAASIPA